VTDGQTDGQMKTANTA